MNSKERLIIEMLCDLEYQINEGEYYSYDRESFNDHVKDVKEIFGYDYDKLKHKYNCRKSK